MQSFHPVLELILERARTKSKPGKRIDSYKVGLAIEGGAMRGIVSAGMLVAMERMGLRDCFDAVYGISIGTGNGAWFLSNQIDAAITSYYERVNNFSFINPLRLLRKKPILSVSFVEEVLNKTYPLDFEEIKRSGIKLGVIVVRVDQSEGKNPLLCLSDFSDREDLMEALAGAVHIPFIAGEPYPYKGMKLWDGGLLERIPVPTAIEDGCTHILTLLNEAHENKSHIPRKIQLAISIKYLKRYNPKLIPYFLKSYNDWDNILTLLKEKEGNYDKTPYIATIALPVGSKALSGFELRHKVLVNGAKAGMHSALKTFGFDQLKVEEELTIIDQLGKTIDLKAQI